jgi:head-tail adaptor
MLLRDRITRLRAPLISAEYGNNVYDWANADEDEFAAEVEPMSSSEDVVNQQRTETRWRLVLGRTADLVATDRVVWDSVTFEVDGEVERHKVRGILHHLEAVLLRVDLAAG